MCNVQEAEYTTADEVQLTGEARRDTDINLARRWLQKQNIPKSGYNKMIKYKYYEFDDFIGYVQQACELYDLSTHFSLEQLQPQPVPRPATMRNEKDNMPTCIGIGKLEVKSIHYHEPRITRVPVTFQLIHQDTGKGINYAKRYAYMIAFEISDSDLVDATNSEESQHKESSYQKYTNGSKINSNQSDTPQVDQTTLNTTQNGRNIMDLARSITEEMSDKGIETTDKNVFRYITQKWKDKELSINEFRELKKKLNVDNSSWK